MINAALQTFVVGFARRTWFIAIVAVGLCAIFAAYAVSSLAEASYLAPPAGSPASSRPGPVARATPVTTVKPPDGNMLVERNMFCSTCVVHDAGPAGATYSGTPAVLIATSVGEQARATVRVIPTNVQGSWGLGETIPGVGKVDQIHFASIEILDSFGHRGTLNLDEPSSGDHGPGAATPGPVDPAKPVDPYADRVKKIDDHTYEVERAMIRELVTSGASPNGVRMSPLMENGEIAGLRVAMARPGSVGAAIGLKTADKLTSVNGEPIKTAQQMLNLLSKLDSLNVVQLEGSRGGKPLQVELRLK